MRIALDARTLFRAERRGIGKSLAELYHHVRILRPQWEILAYHRHRADDGMVEAQNSKLSLTPRPIDAPGDRWSVWERVRLPLAVWADRVDLLHCPANTCPSWMPAPTVVTVHDLIPLDSPQSPPSPAVRRFEGSVQQACRKAAAILSPSEFTRHELIQRMQAQPGRCHVIPWGLTTRVDAIQSNARMSVLQKLGVNEPFVLHYGACDPRKNTRRVIEAWAATDRRLRGDWELLIVGLDTDTLQQMTTVARRLGVADRVHLHGFVGESDLPALLASAAVLAYPSLAEGFGLPILEAWAAGCSVLTSNVSSLPEVAGDAAVLVDPADTMAIARGLGNLIGQRLLRQELAQKGGQRLAVYAWRTAAQKLIDVFESVVGASRLRRAA